MAHIGGFRLSLLWANIFIFTGIWGRTTAEIQMDLNHPGALPLTQTSVLVIAPRFLSVMYQMNKVTEERVTTRFQVNAILCQTSSRQPWKLEKLCLYYTYVTLHWICWHAWGSLWCKWDFFLTLFVIPAGKAAAKILLDLIFRQGLSIYLLYCLYLS